VGSDSHTHTPDRLDWPDWVDSEPFTLGVEEEVMLLDEGDLSLAQRIEDVLPALPPALSPFVSAETHQAAIELATPPADTVAGAMHDLRGLRARLTAAIGPLGLRAATAGTHPVATWQETRVSPAARYELIHQSMGELARREPTFALHVHVGVPDPDDAIVLCNRLRVHLPVLLALSANSPYWQGRDARLASTRTVLFKAFPRTGVPRRFASYADWVRTVAVLLDAGAFPEPTFLWWDVRPQPRFGTVEVRVMDAQSTTAATTALVALVQSVARLELVDGYVDEAAMDADEVLAENRFVSARDGVRAELIDARTASRRPLDDVLDDLLDAARPHAAALGCDEALAGVDALRASGGGAGWQRSHVGDDDDLRPLLSGLADAFAR
jgi:carboxylate-amine ligase